MATALGRELANWVQTRNADTLDLPVTPLSKVPFHRFHRLGVRAAVIWKTVLDRLETRPAGR